MNLTEKSANKFDWRGKIIYRVAIKNWAVNLLNVTIKKKFGKFFSVKYCATKLYSVPINSVWLGENLFEANISNFLAPRNFHSRYCGEYSFFFLFFLLFSLELRAEGEKKSR